MNEYEIIFSSTPGSNQPTLNKAIKYLFGKNCSFDWTDNILTVKSDQIIEINDNLKFKQIHLKDKLLNYIITHLEIQQVRQIWTYINEAENQDGLEYWGQFNTLEELLEDVQLYLGKKED